MKYTGTNKPLVCMMTQSTCYRGTTIMNPKGVLWHSTGVNNPNLKRYVQPNDDASNRNALLAKLGTNTSKNDWNHISIQAGVNAWIGKLANGEIASVQVLPWNFKPWGCGGSCNNGWMQFEICEDNLKDRAYFEAVYKEACELTAYYCKLYGLNPKGTVKFNGKTVPVILCHADSYRLGLGSNHGDVLHWFKKYGKTMDDVREDVAALMGGTYTNVSTCLIRGDAGEKVRKLQEDLVKLGYSLDVDGDFGPATEKVVKQFQKDNNLTQDGIVGSITQSVIDFNIKNMANSSAYSLEQFVCDVQKSIGAKVDGIAGIETLSKTITLSRKVNSKHNVVQYVQKRLYALGYVEVGEADGIFGPATEKAVIRFQKNGGSVQDGEITKGKLSWQRLLGMDK